MVVAKSFGRIFKNNCARNQLLTIELADEYIDHIGDLLVRGEIHNKITIDLKKQTLTTPENKIINYEVDPYLLGMLLKNQDFIDRSLSYEDSIDEFVRKDKKIRPWAYL